MVDARFAALAALATLVVSLLSGLQGAWAPAALFGLLCIGFALRALQGYLSHRSRRGSPPGAGGPREPRR
jgi:hypothetical protein